VGPRCHRDFEKYGAIPNGFWNLRSSVELLYDAIVWICSSGAVFVELEFCQTHPESWKEEVLGGR
jgi:hypothetical protein